MYIFSRNTEEITSKLLQNCNILILPGSQTPFDDNELNCLKGFINEGGRILVLLSEGGNPDDNSNTNILLEEFGIVPNIGNKKN